MFKLLNRRYPISLRYKLAFPVSVFVLLILILLSHATIRIVRDFVGEAFQTRVRSQVENFAESIKPHFLTHSYSILQSRLDTLAVRKEVYGVQIVDREGLTILQSPVFRELPDVEPDVIGVKSLFIHQSLIAVLLRLETSLAMKHFKKFPDLFVAAVPLKYGTQLKEYGTVQIFFTMETVNETIRKIYGKRILFSLLAALGIAFLTASLTWLALRPLFLLRNTVLDILKGKISARAKIHSGDEIEELADAFNEMVNRLDHSMKNLKSRSEALEESEERYRALVENASDVIWLLSDEGKIEFLNQGFAGLSKVDLLRDGLSLFLSFHTEDSIQKFEAALAQVKREKIPANHVATVFHHPITKEEIYYSTNLTPVLARGRELKGIQAVTRDVTELKRVEMMKDRLIRDVAHELKTPVAKFQMTLNWLEKDLEKEPQKKRYWQVLELMKRNSELLMKIIMEIMDLSRLEFGSERLNRGPCDLKGVLIRVCDDLEPLAREKGLALERNLNSGPLTFEGDEAMLYRLFSNLITNSIKFTPEGKIIVSARKEGDYLLSSVTDTGIGLEKEDIERVFDRFFQKTPATHGMGLGLALAKEIILLHGGRIWVESKGSGKGAAFFVEFPI